MLTLTTTDAEAFFVDELPGLLAGERGAMAGRAAADLPALALTIDGRSWTHRSVDGLLEVTDGVADDAVEVVLSARAWSDWHAQTLTVPGLMLTDAVAVEPEDIVTLSEWDLALRALWSGVPVYSPDAVDLTLDGAPIDLARSFTLADADEDIAQHLAKVGFVRIRNVFTAEEIAVMNTDVDRMAANAAEGDGRTWWSDQDDGSKILNRILYADEQSATIGDLFDDQRLDRLGRVLHPQLRAARDRMDGATVLIKPPGELRGLANIPWHQDCGLGGHNIMCPAVGVGIQLTGASKQASQFVGIAGSHGMSAHPLMSEDDLAAMPLVGVDTEPGDVTLHVCDVIHASPPPEGAGGRRTLYLTWFPPSLFEVVGPYEAFNDVIHNRTVSPEDLVAGTI